MKKALAFIFLLLLTSCSPSTEFITINTEEESLDIIIDIKGAIQFPGLYSSTKGVMLYELISTAGGLLENADREKLNLVQVFTGNTSVNIPYQESSSSSKLININSASLEEFMTLNGIGKSKAQAIISYRDNNYFNCIEDLMKVSGIGEQVFSQIKDQITV